MKISVTSVIVFVGGFILIYAGVKNVDPRDVVKAALRGENPGDLAPKLSDTQSSTSSSGGIIKLPNAKGAGEDPTPLTSGSDTVRA